METKCSSPQRWRTNVCKDRYVRGKYPSLSQDPGPRLSWPTWPETRLKAHRPNQWKSRLRMLNQRSIRFKLPTGSRKLSREAFRFRMLSRRCPIRFRTQYQQNTTVYKMQQQLLRPCTVKQAGKLAQGSVQFRALSRRFIRFKPLTSNCKLSRGMYRVRMLNRSRAIRFRMHYPSKLTKRKKQQPLLRSRETASKDPRYEGTFRVRTLNRSSSLQRGSSMHHLQTHPVQVHVQCGKSDAFKMFASGSVKDSTRYIQAVTLHHHQSDWPQKSVKSKESLLRNNYGNQVIRHEL